MGTRKSINSDFILDNEVIHSGIANIVRVAHHKDDGRQYAVKTFDKLQVTPSVQATIKEEVEVYLELDHPHIVRLDQVYENEDEIHIVMDLLSGGTLFDRLHAQKFYQEDQAADTSNQMCSAVAYLYAHKIVHCDLKLENFLYERPDSDHIKLIDFGFAKHVRVAINWKQLAERYSTAHLRFSLVHT